MAKTLREFAEGSTIKLRENGNLVDYLVAKHDYQPDLNGTGRTLLARWSAPTTRIWDSTGVLDFAKSELAAYLNGTFKSVFDEDTQKMMGETSFYYTKDRSTMEVVVGTLSVFLLSGTELAKTYSSGGHTANAEGTELGTASAMWSLKDSANTSIAQWTRSITNTGSIVHIASNVTWGTVGATSTCGPRPVFTLPADKTHMTDDGCVEYYDMPVISGEDAHIGDRDIPFTHDYSVSIRNNAEIKVTELVDGVIQLRSYIAEPDVLQTATVAVQGLSQGDHTLNLVAEADGVTSARVLTFTLPVAYLSPLGEDQGVKGEKFTIPYVCKTYSGVDLSVTETVDGEMIREYTAVSGEEQEMTVDTEKLTDTEHEIEIIATGDGETKSAKSVFRVAPIVLSDGGSVQELQGFDGKPVYPATIAKAIVRTNGESVEQALVVAEKELSGLMDVSDVCLEKIQTSGLWKVPKARDQLFKVVCVGGGGSGAGTGQTNNIEGSGGGGGYVETATLVLQEGEEVEIICGAGGVSSNVTGNDGGETIFGDFLSAQGGKGGVQSGKGGDGGSGGGGSGRLGTDGGNAGQYGGGGAGCGSTSYVSTATGKGGDGGKYGGGGGGTCWYRTASANDAVKGRGGTGGKYGGAGGDSGDRVDLSQDGHTCGIKYVVSMLDVLFDAARLTELTDGKGGVSKKATYSGGAGGAGVMSAGGDSNSGGGGGGGYGAKGGNATGAGGAGGGGFFGAGGTSSGMGGAGGGGFFADGGGTNTFSGGGGGGFFSAGGAAFTTAQGTPPYAVTFYNGGAGGNGGVLVIYQKEEETE